MFFETICCSKATFSRRKICGICQNDYEGSNNSAVKVVQHTNPVKHSPPNSICIRLTVGLLLKDYSRNALLHVGICDQTGTVWHWNEFGLHADKNGWDDCISCSFSPDDVVDATEAEQVAKESVKYKVYTAKGFNCFAFAVSVMNKLNISINNVDPPHSKESLVEGAVANVMNIFEAYLAIFSRIEESNEGWIVLDAPPASNRYNCDGCTSPIDGSRWHCNECEDFDLCSHCYEENDHDDSHTFSSA